MVKALVILDNKMQASIIIFRAISVMGEMGLLKWIASVWLYL